jgi:hypothetical protein
VEDPIGADIQAETMFFCVRLVTPLEPDNVVLSLMVEPKSIEKA